MIPPEYRDLDDPSLIARCLAGDAVAWEALIDRYRRLIYGVPSRFRFAPVDCADVFQAVCVSLIEHLHELRDETRVGPWLATTAKRQCLRLRERKRREPVFADESKGDEFPDSAMDTERFQILLEEQERVRRAVARLSPRCRALIELLFFRVDTRSYEQIGQTLEMPVPSIGPTRARCLAKLRELLRPPRRRRPV